jgi:hypothetical protein
MVLADLVDLPQPFHDAKRRPESVGHVLVPPAGRVEAIVTGPNDSGIPSSAMISQLLL